MILRAVERDQHPSVEAVEHLQSAVDPLKLIDGFSEYRTQQHRRGRIEHVPNMIVAGDFSDAEQTGAVGAAMPLLEPPLMCQERRLCMKNTEKAAIPMSPMPKVVFMPRRLSGNRSKQPRSDPSRESSRPTHPTNRIRGFLRIPYFGAAKRFTPTVVFATHRRCRDSDSIALRTAVSDQGRL